MKKKPSKKPGSKVARRPNSRRAASAGPEAKAVAAAAVKLRARVDNVHRKAESLHKGIERAHVNAGALRQQAEPEPLLLSPDIIEANDVRIIEERSSQGKPFPIVGIGASAGGFEAFSDLLKNLPRQTGMAFVLVQHLDPTHRSQLSDLLARASPLPVQEVTDNTEVEPDHIYVIPANANLTLAEGRLRLAARKEHESPPMPIDLFFRSLAAEQQDRAVGIVLSGTGTDGTLGIEAIKGEGGITFAQSETSAKYFG